MRLIDADALTRSFRDVMEPLPYGYGGLKKIAKLDGEVHYYSVESGE